MFQCNFIYDTFHFCNSFQRASAIDFYPLHVFQRSLASRAWILTNFILRVTLTSSRCSDSSQELYSSQTSSEQTSPVRAVPRCRRPESPPPIRSHHQLLYLPYSSHYHYQHHADYGQQQWQQANDCEFYPKIFKRVNSYYVPTYLVFTNDIYYLSTDNRMHSYYQQQARSGASTPQPAAAQPQRAHYTHALQLQVNTYFFYDCFLTVLLQNATYLNIMYLST